MNRGASACPTWLTPKTYTAPASVANATRSPSVAPGNHECPGTGTSPATGRLSTAPPAADLIISAGLGSGNARSFIAVGPSDWGSTRYRGAPSIAGVMASASPSSESRG